MSTGGRSRRAAGFAPRRAAGLPARGALDARGRVPVSLTGGGDRAGTTRLLLVRHGESTWNADGRWQGQADPPLTERGRLQASLAAQALGSIDAIASSDLERAAETASIIAARLGLEPVLSEPA